MNHTLKLNLLACLFIFILQTGYSQTGNNENFCGTEIPSQAWNEEFQKLVEQRKANTANKTNQNNYIIPVIVHVIHGGQAVGVNPNIAQAQINSQILVLNNDFAGIGYNSNTYPQFAFFNWASANNISSVSLDANGRIKIADCGVQFCLATVDTLGNTLPEPGIDRINWATRGWTDPASITLNSSLKSLMENTIKPQTIWNVSKYLNIWVTDRNANLSDGAGNGGILGYATFPPLSQLSGLSGVGNSTNDGFWCYSKCFGSATTFAGTSSTYFPGYNRGRTSTHEIGHYLGLRHIWGDCSSGVCCVLPAVPPQTQNPQLQLDYCTDTPAATDKNFGAPNYPLFKTPTSCYGNAVDGEMFMNFMDYTNDPVKYMFTTDQATRVQTAMANSPYRKFLGTHNVCGQIPVAASFLNSFLACPGVDITLSNTSLGFPAASYTWASTGGTFSPNTSATSPTISFSTPGTYIVTLTADNGIISTFSKTITVQSPVLTLSPSSPTICNGSALTISASGSNTYTWQPGGIINNAANYSPTQSQTYTCEATHINGCKSFSTIAIIVTECTGISQVLKDQVRFNVYPNPAKDQLHIVYFPEKNVEVNVEIIDALGKISLSQEVLFSKEKQNQTLNISSLSNGVYFVKLKSGNNSPQFIKLVKE